MKFDTKSQYAKFITQIPSETISEVVSSLSKEDAMKIMDKVDSSFGPISESCALRSAAYSRAKSNKDLFIQDIISNVVNSTPENDLYNSYLYVLSIFANVELFDDCEAYVDDEVFKTKEDKDNWICRAFNTDLNTLNTYRYLRNYKEQLDAEYKNTAKSLKK